MDCSTIQFSLKSGEIQTNSFNDEKFYARVIMFAIRFVSVVPAAVWHSLLGKQIFSFRNVITENKTIPGVMSAI